MTDELHRAMVDDGIITEEVVPTAKPMEVLQFTLAGIESVAENCSGTFADPMKLRVAELKAAIAQVAALVAFVGDLAEHGTRFGMNPCLDHSPANVASEYLRYIRRIDDSMRERAIEALAPFKETP